MKEKEAISYFKWFDGREYPKEEIRLTCGGKITNIKKFVDSHLPIAKENYKNRTFLPYVLRLDEVKKHIESKNEVQKK